jgi:putative DNA methylase
LFKTGEADILSAHNTIKTAKQHKGWHSRGYLPHFDHPDLVQSINFRLYDSVPAEVVIRWKQKLEVDEAINPRDPKLFKFRKRIEKFEDTGHGACFLRDERVAEMVQNTLLHFDQDRYMLIAWCVMPNHVHVMIEMIRGFTLSNIMHSWKSFSAKKANKILNRSGEFWMSEYFDRFIRDERHFYATKTYILNNPVKAGLCEKP